MKPDAIDARILGALMEDGRASFRQIAQRTSLTTPTVSARLARMMKSGLIKRFAPIIAADALNRGVVALVSLKVESASVDKVAKELAKLREVEGVYVTTGENGITLKATLESVQDVQPFLRENITGKRGVEVASSQIITSIVKEEPPSLLPSMLTMHLKCDYCGGDVTSSRPYNIVAGPSHYYFCCKTCRKAYLEEHRKRIRSFNARLTA